MAVVSMRYFVKRTLQTVLMVWVVLTFLFFFFRLMPGNFADIMLFRGSSPEAIAKFRADWGLDDPLYVQYYRYVLNLLQGNAGMSLQFRRPVFEYVKMGIFNSFILIAPGITLGYILGSIYGVIAGTNRGSWIEKHGIVPLFFIGAFPSFFLAIMLIIVFAGWLDIFPTSGILTQDTRRLYADAPWWRTYLTKDFLMHYTLPFMAIVLRYLFLPSLIMRTSIIEVKDQEFNYYHRMTGIPKVKRLIHLAKHASLPVITLYPVSMTRAIGGLVLIEMVFNWPGIGYMLVQAVLARDYPVVMFVFFLVAVFIVIANYVVDIVYGIIDPRVSVE